MKETSMKWKKRWFIPIFLISIAVSLLFFTGCFTPVIDFPSVPNDYTKRVSTKGELEAKYMAMGGLEVDYYEAAAFCSFAKYELYYPKNISNMNALPVVIFVNGTGCKGTKYPALQKHMASWGFITVATEEEYAWNGFSAEMSVRFLETLNGSEEIGEKPNMFYNKIDLQNVGITGHSQGGIGVINAITEQRHADIYKSAVILSCGNTEASQAFLWDFDESKINTPTMIVGSTGNVDAEIAPLESLTKLYDNISDEVTKVIARRKNADHGEMLYFADGYVTAWFMYYLKNDTRAGKAFFGDDAELPNNELYQDIQVNN